MKRITWFFFILLVIYFIFLIRQDIIDNLEMKKEFNSVERKLSQAEASVAGYQDRMARVKNESLIEELSRTRLGLIKKGETAYKVIR